MTRFTIIKRKGVSILSDEIGVLELYFREIADHEIMTMELQNEFMAELDSVYPKRLADNDQSLAPDKAKEIVNEIAGHFYKLVISVANSYTGHGVDLMDLIQEGNLGLLKGIWKFDNSVGVKLSTYVTWWIRQSVARSLADQGRTIRIPNGSHDRWIKICKFITDYERETGKSPTYKEVAKSILPELTPEATKRLHLTGLKTDAISLDKQLAKYQDEDYSIYNFADSDTPPVNEYVELSELKKEMDKALSTITAREALILKLRFGLCDGVQYTLEEVGQRFGLTRERIRQIEAEALRKLRHPRRSRTLKEYVR